MKSFSAGMQQHLDSGTTTLAWCWRITRADGVVFGFTDHDLELSFDGTAFESEAGLIPSEVRTGSDLAVDSQDAEGVLTSDRITQTDILDGLWDNAEVEVWRVNWSNPAERILLRRGAIGEIRRGRIAFLTEVRSLAHTLGQTVGRAFQATCDAELGDGRCKINLELAAYRASGSIVDLLDERSFIASGLAGFNDQWFTAGTVTWSSGANGGRRAEVMLHQKTSSLVTIRLLEEPVRPIAVGNNFVIRAGCDKRFETCTGKFSNAVNFRGFPHIPGQDAMIRYATKDGGHDGGVL